MLCVIARRRVYFNDDTLQVSSDSNYNWINMPYGEGNSLQNGQGNLLSSLQT